MNTKALIIVIVLVLFGAGAFLLSGEPTDEKAATTTPVTTATGSGNGNGAGQSSAGVAVPVYSEAEVAMHTSKDDCWTIVDGSVYNITDYVPRHPGGDDILLACGVDGSSLFNTSSTEAGDKVGSGTPHSAKAASQLTGFLIGSI